MYPTAAAAAGTAPAQAGPAVLVVLGIVGIWWLAAHGKGEVKLRLLAWILLPVIAWLLVAAHDPAGAGRIASGAAAGASTALSSLGKLVSGA